MILSIAVSVGYEIALSTAPSLVGIAAAGRGIDVV
jgi:hypothetical protein